MKLYEVSMMIWLFMAITTGFFANEAQKAARDEPSHMTKEHALAIGADNVKLAHEVEYND